MGDKQKYLDDKTKGVLDNYGLPNIASVLVRDNGQTVVHSVMGVRDSSLPASDATNKATKDDFFNVGSISKPITGFLLACLIKQNLLTWETTISDVFPEFKAKAFRDRCGMNGNFLDVRVFELMAHTAGIDGVYYHVQDDDDAKNGDTDPYRFIADQGIQSSGNSRGPEWQNPQALMYQRYLYAVLDLKRQKYTYKAQHNFHYQNKAVSGYGSTPTICAAMVERLTGVPFETTMANLLSGTLTNLKGRMIFGKLPNGMQFHGFDTTTGKFVPEYSYNNDFAPYLSKFVVGGIHLTVEGMAQLIRYNLRAIDNSAIFDIDQYHAPVTNAAQGGFFLGGDVNKEPLNHKGATGASLALLYIFPKGGYGYAVMQNCNHGEADKANGELMNELGTLHKDWNTI